jgi:Uma2 family endonuclease
MSITLNPPAGPWTVDELGRVPDAGYRFEIHEGNLVMMSPVTLWHSRMMLRLWQVLVAQGRAADVEVGVKRSDRSMRVSDVAVFRTAKETLNVAFWAPEELELVVEIVSDASEEDDRQSKLRWYAAAGVPAYWRVERSDVGEAVIYQFELASTASGESAYIQTGISTLTALETSG